MKNKKYLFLLLITSYLLLPTSCLYSQHGGKFVFAQLKYSGNWDPRTNVWNRISEFLTVSTSIKSIQERRIVTISDEELFWLPFLVITGDSDFAKFSDDEIKIIIRYLQCGGMIFIDDSSGKKGSGFDKSIRDMVNKISPENPLERIPPTDAMLKSFYLLQNVSGRIITNRYFEGCKIGERYSIIYSQNDLLGAWEKDNLGNYIYPCDDKQRWEAKKMTINIILYALTGTYKSDTIHLPFIKSKLK
ncbi:MAG: DUF4159 domain-containing protein [Elusimicrobiota bacterium]|nr:DUF4159 domain-containing protein [Elusimicrobiota bacterium]